MRLLLALFIFLSTVSHAAEYKLIYNWEDDFSAAEKEKVQQWIRITYDAVQKKIGEYPFDVHLFIYRREGEGEPCPWANTWRYPNQQVHFYIDPTYSLEDFLADWTAPHELSHLAIPYIGEKEPWFSEGFASFMQYQVMMEMDLMTQGDCDSAYLAKLSSVEGSYKGKRPFSQEAMENKSNGNYKAMYWGGASFFMKWNKHLVARGTSLCELFPEYLKLYRKKSRGVGGVVEHLDLVAGDDFGKKMLAEYRNKAVSSLFPE